MKDLIKKILRERWDWDNLDEAVPVPKGDLKRYIIHSTNVDPRIIYNEGINPVCASESKEWKNYKYPCVVFAMNGYHNIWAQGKTKGAVVIDTSLLPNHNWWYDPAFYNEKGWSGKISIITDEKIPADAIKGILCLRDLGDMRYKFHINTTDEEAQQFLDEVMIENYEDWSNDCEAKMDYIYNKEMEDITENKKTIKEDVNKIPEAIRKQIDDLFDSLEYTGDEDTIFFHRNGEPLFANFENIMGLNDVAFFRDLSNPVFYFMEASPTINEYVKEKVRERLINLGMPEDSEFYLYTFKPEKDKQYKEVFYEILEDGGMY